MKTSTLRRSNIFGMLALAVALLVITRVSAAAATVYAANISGQLQSIDTTTGIVTNLYSNPGQPFGLVAGQNQILYTTISADRLDVFDTSTQINSTLVGVQAGQQGRYVTMDPGGNSALFSVFGLGIERYNFTTQALTQVSSDTGALGLAYDAAGHLFVVTAPNQVAQMDPNTGAILNTVTLPATGGAGANGLAFDSLTGKLYATDDLNDVTARGVYAIPTNLSGATLLAGTLNVFANGLTSDGNGQLYIAAGNSLDEYFISTDTVQIVGSDPGINDVALATMVQQTTPEPSSLMMLGTGVVGLAGVLRRGFKV